MPQTTRSPGKARLSPTDQIKIVIDHQSKMAMARSVGAWALHSNRAPVGHAARIFGVADILATVGESA
jgi:hypothetical protein